MTAATSPELPAPLAALVAEFAALDRAERFELLIEFADRFRPAPAEIAGYPYAEEHRVTHCESDAYVWAEGCPGSALKFHFIVENPQGLSARAWATILDETLSGQPIEQIAAVPPDIVFAFFGREVAMGRGQGLMGMLALVQRLARNHRKGA